MASADGSTLTTSARSPDDRPSRGRLDGGGGMLEAFRALGVDYVFSSPGSEWAPVWEAFARQRQEGEPGPRYLDLTHESLAVGMATGYALITQRGQVVLLHAGAGLLQGANAIHGALLSGAPMVVSSSESITYGEGEGPDPGSQWYRNLSVVGGPHTLASGFVKWANQAPTPEVLYEMVLRAGEIAGRQPTGPVYLNVPLETLLADWSPPAVHRPVAAPGRRVSAPEDVERVADALLSARWPLVITETAGRDERTFAALKGFAESLGIGVVEPRSAVCANFDRTSPLHLGERPPAGVDVDLLLLVNARAPWYPPSANPYPNARVVVIDEVPQRPHIVYQVLHATDYLEGEVAATLDALRVAVSARLDGFDVERRSAEFSRLHEAHEQAITSAELSGREAGDAISTALLVSTLRELLPQDAIVVDETITHSGELQRYLRASEFGRWLYVQGGLGQGSGVALGVKLAVGERMVVLAIGDGTFLYNPMFQGLMASRDLGLPVLIVVFNNRQYLSMKMNHLRFYPDGVAVRNDDHDGVKLSGQPPLSELATPFGFLGCEVHHASELADALAAGIAAVADGRAAVINVHLGDGNGR
ncbi:MAG TPA: thiamine pyrophosphate-binding protein [Solirubrobacteraceae bacterium]|nr:thiamine pyrophosphate-binding protein [Solirubrobacteraceae bacterium]